MGVFLKFNLGRKTHLLVSEPLVQITLWANIFEADPGAGQEQLKILSEPHTET